MVPPLRGRPILFITRMITDRIGLHLVLLSLLIEYIYLDLVISYMRLSIVCCCFFLNLFILLDVSFVSIILPTKGYPSYRSFHLFLDFSGRSVGNKSHPCIALHYLTAPLYYLDA